MKTFTRSLVMAALLAVGGLGLSASSAQAQAYGSPYANSGYGLGFGGYAPGANYGAYSAQARMIGSRPHVAHRSNYGGHHHRGHHHRGHHYR